MSCARSCSFLFQLLKKGFPSPDSAYEYELNSLVAHEGSLTNGHCELVLSCPIGSWLMSHPSLPRHVNMSRTRRCTSISRLRLQFSLLQLTHLSLQFWCFDDDKVRRATLAEVLAAKAYLLIYTRKSK